MGSRQNVRLEYADGDKLYIYSHWDGGLGDNSELLTKVRKAIARKERWDDESYLARIIFSEIVADSITESTGYGLAPYEMEEQYSNIVVNFKNKTVNGVSFEEFIKNT